MPICTFTIWVRYYGQAYIARCDGRRASSTSSRKQAAEAVARKVLGDKEHTVRAVDKGELMFEAVTEVA